MAALAEFDAALGRIGLEQAQRNAIIETSECMNIAMLGLLLVDQLSKVCKRLETRAVNLIRISTLQRLQRHQKNLRLHRHGKFFLKHLKHTWARF